MVNYKGTRWQRMEKIDEPSGGNLSIGEGFSGPRATER